MFTAIGFARNPDTGKWTDEVTATFENLSDAKEWVEDNHHPWREGGLTFLHVFDENNCVVYTPIT